MCGRYALGIRAAFVRYQLQQQGLPVNDAPEDEEVRETYNFPPGSYGLVYRADIPDQGVRDEDTMGSNETSEHPVHTNGEPKTKYNYHLKVMKWGLIPFWTKRSPEYGSLLRTINCRDDSLIENRGMWTSMKQKKRCIVICQGFYEWLKKGPGGKEKVPHFVKRKDGQLMCFAGLWDCVKYEDSEEKLYTYTIITTDSNKQLSFLHDRMPVILDAGSDDMKIWLDPERNKWSSELQSLLVPYKGELECYPVHKDVGKVGNNSPNFIVPIDSKENKKNIANFFGNAQKSKPATNSKEVETKHDSTDDRQTIDHESTEDNAPIPVPPEDTPKTGEKRGHSPSYEKPAKVGKLGYSKPLAKASPKRPRSATKNETSGKKSSPVKKATDGTQRITNFLISRAKIERFAVSAPSEREAV